VNILRLGRLSTAHTSQRSLLGTSPTASYPIRGTGRWVVDHQLLIISGGLTLAWAFDAGQRILTVYPAVSNSD